MHAGGVELSLVERGVRVGVGERPFETLELQGCEFVARGGFDRLEVAGTRREVLHPFLPCALPQRTWDCAVMSAKFGDQLASLVSDGDVVDAAASAQMHLARMRRQ